MKRDIKINVSVLWAVYYKITAYRDALTDMETASSHFLSVLESQDSATYERLAEVWKQNVQMQESVLKERLNSIAQVLSDYIYDMEACIMPKDESQMMRVDRNDIWWNYDQIEGNVEDLEDILDDTGSSWKDYDGHYWYNPFLSEEENDERKKKQEDEEARESGRRQRNYNKLAGFRSTLSSKLSNELSTYVSQIKKIHEENVIDFENTDDSYKTKMDDLYSDWASFWDRVTDVWDVIVDVGRGVIDAAVDLVVGIKDLAVGVLKVVTWLSLKGSVFDTFGLIPEKLEADVQGIFSGIKTIFKDPKGVLEAMGQSIADTVDEEGIAYSISYVTSDIVIGILVDKGIGKLKSLNKVDDVANVATDAGKVSDDIAGVAGKSSDEMAEVAGGAGKVPDDVPTGTVDKGNGKTAKDVIKDRVQGLDLNEHPTDYKQLNSTKMKELKNKIDNRTATKEEYELYEWNKRISRRRSEGVKDFWNQERERILGGENPTREWTEEQIKDILNGKTPTYNGKAIQGHHSYSVSKYPHLANKGEVIYPVTPKEHFYGWHGGNYKNSLPGEPIVDINELD